MNLHASHSPRQLLVVDDDHDLADAICEWIELSSDWTAVGAYGPADAIARAGSAPPDAVLLDMEMGDADGFDTARRVGLAAGAKHPALLALTGNAGLRDKASANARFAGSFLKPADLPGLLELLEAMPPRH